MLAFTSTRVKKTHGVVISMKTSVSLLSTPSFREGEGKWQAKMRPGVRVRERLAFRGRHPLVLGFVSHVGPSLQGSNKSSASESKATPCRRRPVRTSLTRYSLLLVHAFLMLATCRWVLDRQKLSCQQGAMHLWDSFPGFDF